MCYYYIFLTIPILKYRYEYLDSNIILPTCDQDGKLLMADGPAKAAPIQILNMAFSNHHNPKVPHSLEQGKLIFLMLSYLSAYFFLFLSSRRNLDFSYNFDGFLRLFYDFHV